MKLFEPEWACRDGFQTRPLDCDPQQAVFKAAPTRMSKKDPEAKIDSSLPYQRVLTFFGKIN